MVSDPENMGVNTYFVQLYWPRYSELDFPIMAALICITMISGTFRDKCMKLLSFNTY